ncbi:hypothetical protein QR685DRAFT_186258 [Neurospora intermedia]|uniref:Uncharacterized protein n=1 Tax=Neurospora intermedia TaxID=5142 RepID=A0ABR3DN66_NEUIN
MTQHVPHRAYEKHVHLPGVTRCLGCLGNRLGPQRRGEMWRILREGGHYCSSCYVCAIPELGSLMSSIYFQQAFDSYDITNLSPTVSFPSFPCPPEIRCLIYREVMPLQSPTLLPPSNLLPVLPAKSVQAYSTSTSRTTPPQQLLLPPYRYILSTALIPICHE